MKRAALLFCLASVAASPAMAEKKPSPAANPSSQAVAAARKEHFDEAHKLAAQSKDKVLQTLIRWMDFQSPRGQNNFADITAFIAANPDWPLLGQMQRRAEEAISAATPDDQVLAWYKNRDPLTADGSMALARAQIANGQGDAAAAVIRRAWMDNGLGLVQEHQFLNSYGEYLRPQDHWARLDRLLWDRQDGPAQRMLARVSPQQRDLAQARMALQAGKTNAEQLADQIPAELRDDPGLGLDRVRWRRQKDMDDQAMDLLLSHPGRNRIRPEVWWQERSTLARRALQRGMVSRAYQIAADHGLDARTSASQYADAEFLAGWIALRYLDEPDAAMGHFQRLSEAVTTPLSRSRAAYWAGRTAERRGQSQPARDWYALAGRYPTAYYGQLALSRLNENRWPLPADPQPSPEDRKRFDSRELTHAARLLLQAGDVDAVRAFFIRLNEVAQTPGERALVGAMALQGGRNDLAVTVARRADRDSVFLVSAGWPVMAVTDDGPEKSLVLALIRQESGFMPTIQSPVGARGLMQLMPATAERVAKSLKVAFNPGKLDDPDFNVRLGRAYLGDLLKDFEGSYIMALAGYNAGPSRVRKWVKEYGDPRDASVDVVDWIEMIPFTETRNYVQRVMESVSIYRRKLEAPADTTFEQDLKRWARRPVDSNG